MKGKLIKRKKKQSGAMITAIMLAILMSAAVFAAEIPANGLYHVSKDAPEATNTYGLSKPSTGKCVNLKEEALTFAGNAKGSTLYTNKHFTGNRKKYLIRLYLLGILMSIGNIVISFLVRKETVLCNNIFVTLFLGAIIVSYLDMKNTNKENVKRLILLVAQQIIAFLLCAIFAEFLQIPDFVDTYMLYYGYSALFGSAIFTEGSIWFVLFFVIVYFLKEKKCVYQHLLFLFPSF